MRTPNRTRVSRNWDLGFWNGVESYPIGDTGIQPIGIVLSSQWGTSSKRPIRVRLTTGICIQKSAQTSAISSGIFLLWRRVKFSLLLAPISWAGGGPSEVKPTRCQKNTIILSKTKDYIVVDGGWIPVGPSYRFRTGPHFWLFYSKHKRTQLVE